METLAAQASLKGSIYTCPKALATVPPRRTARSAAMPAVTVTGPLGKGCGGPRRIVSSTASSAGFALDPPRSATTAIRHDGRVATRRRGQAKGLQARPSEEPDRRRDAMRADSVSVWAPASKGSRPPSSNPPPAFRDEDPRQVRQDVGVDLVGLDPRVRDGLELRRWRRSPGRGTGAGSGRSPRCGIGLEDDPVGEGEALPEGLDRLGMPADPEVLAHRAWRATRPSVLALAARCRSIFETPASRLDAPLRLAIPCTGS